MRIFVTLRNYRTHHDGYEENGQIGFEVDDANAVRYRLRLNFQNEAQGPELLLPFVDSRSFQSLRRAADVSHGEVYG